MELELIDAYSRQDALNDGVLIDVTTQARVANFRYPVAVTAAVWGKYIEVPTGVIGQKEDMRLWEFFIHLRLALREASKGNTVFFMLYVRNDNEHAKPVTLKAICGPNDDGSPAITIMLCKED